MTLQIDNALVQEVQRKSGVATPDEAVAQVLRDFVSKKEVSGGLIGNPQDILDLFGTVEFDADYDYKAERRRDIKRLPNDADC